MTIEDGVVLSIKPKWVSKILSGEKTVEIRKDSPAKSGLRFKTYIYSSSPVRNVVGEFLCNGICKETISASTADRVLLRMLEGSCVSPEELFDYLRLPQTLGVGSSDIERDFYLWNISNLQIYDKPLELSYLGIQRPPMSWGYVLSEKAERA